MSHYRYHEDWLVSERFDCHFWVTCRSLSDALWIAALKSRDAHISVHADCEHAGIKTTVHVGLPLRQLHGKTVVEIMDLFDAEVDRYIACRVKIGKWGHENCT